MIRGVGSAKRRPSGVPMLDFYDDPETVADTLANHATTHRVRSFAVYGTTTSPMCALILHPKSASMSGAKQRLVLALELGEIEEEVEAQASEGYLPLQISATGEGVGASYGLLFSQRADPHPPIVVPHARREAFFFGAYTNRSGMAVSAALQEVHNTLGNVLSVDMFSAQAAVDQESYAFAAVLSPYPQARQFWRVQTEWSTPSFATHPNYDASRRGFSRPEHIVPTVDGTFVLAYWRGDTLVPWDMNPDTFTGGTIAVGPLTGDQIPAKHDDLTALGYWPMTVGANGPRAGARFGLVYGPAGQSHALKRTFTTTDSLSPIFQPFPSAFQPGDANLLFVRPFHSAPAEEPGIEIDTGLPLAELAQPGRAFAPGLRKRTRDVRPSPMDGVGRNDDAPGQRQAEPPPGTFAPPVVALNPIDTIAKRLLKESGAKACQIAVARNGRLVYAKAYTFAEEGYAECSVRDLLRIGSVTKPITGLALMKQIGPGGYDAKLIDILGISFAPHTYNPNRRYFERITLEHLVRHAAGWGDTGAHTESFNYWDVADTLGKSYLEPGDYVTFLTKEVGETGTPLAPAMVLDLFKDQPGALPEYSNYTYTLLGETLATLHQNNREEYESAVRSILQLPPNEIHLISDSFADARMNGEFFCHTPFMGASIYAKTGALEPAQYASEFASGGGAGYLATSAVTLVRIASGLDPNATYQTLPDPAHVRGLLVPATFQIDGPNGTTITKTIFGYRTFGNASVNYLFAGDGIPTAMRSLRHNGVVQGGGAWLEHMIPDAPPTAAPTDLTPSVTFAFIIAADSPASATIMDDLRAAIEAYENTVGWPMGDLFDVF